MDQTTEDGKCIGDQIMDDVHIETALVKEQNGKTVLLWLDMEVSGWKKILLSILETNL